MIVLSAVIASGAAIAETGLAQRIAAADPAAGAAAFTTCKVCHATEAGTGHQVGPNLWNVVGRDVAGATGFDYSEALRKLPGRWTYEALDVFLTDPAARAPGTRMAFPGIADASTRAAVIRHLRDLSDAPVPLPVAKAADDTAKAAATADTDPFGADWPEGPGRRETGFLCNACHSLAIVKQQRLSRERWDEMLDWMVEEQGMPALDAAERERVLGYLEGQFGADRPR